MKKLILAIVLSFIFVAHVHADRWCQWSGTEGFGCLTQKDGGVTLPDGTHITNPADANAAGYYRLIISHPAVGADEIKDAMVWGFTSNEISLTWTVRALTQTETDTRDAVIMSKPLFELIQGMIALNLFTLQQASDWFSPEVVAAYQARKRLENP